MQKSLFVTLLLTLVITACAPAAATEPPSIIIPRPTVTPSPEESTPEQTELGPVEQAVVKQLAANLNLQDEDIAVLRSEETEFEDACLGVTMPDVMCAQVITPGRVILLEAEGIQYEYHISEDGGQIQPATLALVWKREGGIAGFCDTLTVFLSGEVFGSKCTAQAEGRMGTFADLLTAREQEQFNEWIAAFAETNLDTSDPKGVADRMVVTLEFFGNGSEAPTQSEQQALFKFAQDLYQELAK